ncbi:PHP domain-containing protein [Haladaptatus salinisoli]|uniref:PHP domain-containing protein n=1 Tax=Haladaptatus salinisoli TaxID=2884876 RepID=UPI001D0B801B|nr:PHP domain-containing protein [Haladaptatus salinisoli]
MQDCHIHSNYSDGTFLSAMVRAAEETEFTGVGFADHCNVSPRDVMADTRALQGFNLDVTYERRRRAIRRLREDAAVEIHDAVEVDYEPRDETRIRNFLEEGEFDYALGSVHWIDDANVQVESNFSGKTADELDAIVDRYFEKLVALVESELFEVAAHVDLVERTEALRGRATREHYRRTARALADSRTIPEINAGRALTDAGVVHPDSGFLDVLREYDIPVAVGTDSHRPDEIGRRAEFLAELLADRDLEPVAPPEFRS